MSEKKNHSDELIKEIPYGGPAPDGPEWKFQRQVMRNGILYYQFKRVRNVN